MDAVKWQDPTQVREALAKANSYRFAVATERKKIAQMPADEAYDALAELIETCDDPALLSGRLTHWLTAPKFSGQTKANQAIACLNLKKADRRLRELTPRQRTELAAMVRHRLNVRKWRTEQLMGEAA